MVRELTDEELACKLEEFQVDRVILDEAARRIRECELRTLIHTNEMVSAVRRSPLIDDRRTDIVEQLLMAVPSRRVSSTRLSSLASRILRGAEYTDEEVKSLAASVMSQDETPGQS